MSDLECRGYVGSRTTMAGRTPQHVQNIVIRDYARRRNLNYLLSAVEYTMEGSYLVLSDLVDNIDSVDGLILYSVFMLPEDESERQSIYERVLGTGKALHFAVEDFSVETPDDVNRIEDLFLIQQFLESSKKAAV